MIESYLAQFALLTGGIWTLTEVLHRRPWVKSRISADLLALIIGVVGSVVLTMSGIFETPEGVSIYWHLAGMVFLGLVAVATAGIAHDKIVKPVAKVTSREGLRCPNCQTIMEPSGKMLPSAPPKYEFKCPACGRTDISSSREGR